LWPHGNPDFRYTRTSFQLLELKLH
jgi:hypothetical protein